MTACADIAVAMLAAGQSRRFGSDKLMADLDGIPLGLHIARTLAPIGFGWRFAVCHETPGSHFRHSRECGNPANNLAVESGIPASAGMTEEGGIAAFYHQLNFEILANDQPLLGQSHSLHLAVRAAFATKAKALLILLADMPFVSARHIAAIATQDGLAASTSSKRPMPPVIFPRDTWLMLLATSGDTGARGLLGDATLVSAPTPELRDIDLVADLRETRVR